MFKTMWFFSPYIFYCIKEQKKSQMHLFKKSLSTGDNKNLSRSVT